MEIGGSMADIIYNESSKLLRAVTAKGKEWLKIEHKTSLKYAAFPGNPTMGFLIQNKKIVGLRLREARRDKLKTKIV